MQAARDPLGALVPGPQPDIAGAAVGPLAGVTFAAKDLYDVAGFVTGGGNPDWAAEQQPAARHAWAVQRLLDAGARLVGKTITDELAYSVNGQNLHYGTPTNPAAPGRLPGGSSSGSAAAVAGGLVDTALGTDTGGSVRVPASFCGLYGLRPTHGAISLDGVIPLAPSLDTVGWFARDAAMLGRVGAALLPPEPEGPAFRRLLVASDAFALALPGVAEALVRPLTALERYLTARRLVTLDEPAQQGIPRWVECFRLVQGREVGLTHGDWVRRRRPNFAPDVAERFAWAMGVTAEQAAAAEEPRRALRARLDGFLGEDALLALPSAPGIAPLLTTPLESLAEWRFRVLSLSSIAPLTGLPQVSLPLAEVEGCPVGLSLIAPRGRDRALLAFVARFCAER